MAKREDIVVGLDIGTTKICAVVGEITDLGVDIIGIGSHPSKGLKNGVVVNIESTVSSIKKAVEEAELMAGCEINSVYVGIAGGHIKGFNSHGVVAIKNREVTPQDIKRVIDAATAVAIPLDREVLHAIPQEFIVDGQDGIKDPFGMSGVRLEAKVHIVSGAIASAQNIVKCTNRAGLNVKDIVLEQLASCEAVLTLDEKELGVALVDIGGDTADIAIIQDGSIKHTSVLPLGGNLLTSDIAVGLKTSIQEAEKIKRKYGCALSSMVKKDETVEVPTIGTKKTRNLSRQILCEIIEPRVEEILTLVSREITKACSLDLLPCGLVITGGAAIMEGMPEMAEQIFNLPIRRGLPMGIGGLVDVVNSPIYATGVGLVLFGSNDESKNRFRIRDENIFAKVTKRMKNWFKIFF